MSFAEPPSGKLEALLTGGKACGEFEIFLNDSAIAENSVPHSVRAEVRRYRLTGERVWTELAAGNRTAVSGLNFENPRYGDLYRVSGTLSRPDRVDGYAFDYGTYLHRTGIDVQIRCSGSSLLERGGGIAVRLIAARNRLLDQLTAPMKNKDAKALCEGILFGFTRNISPEIKSDFIRTGTIHILSVSGTHVGLFAALMLLVFSVFPFRLRLVCVIAATFLYAWLTGLRAPSFRAAFMLSFFLGARLFLLRSSAMNTLLMSAAVLLILNPLQLYLSGFLYSFLTVAALIAVAPHLSAAADMLMPEKHFLPPKFQSPIRFFTDQILRRILYAFLISLTAGAAGFALTLYFQGVVSALSVFVNLCLLPVVWLCFPAMVLSLCGLPQVLEFLLSLILNGVGWLSGPGVFHLVRPPQWFIFCLILLSFLFLIRKKVCYLVLLILLAGGWCFRLPDREILMICGGRSPYPAVIITDPAGHCADILNMPDYPAAAETAAFLNSRGIARCRYFTAQDHRIAASAGFPVLCGRVRMDEAAVDWRLRAALEKRMPELPETLTEKIPSDPLTKRQSGDTFRFVFPDSGIAVEICNYPDGSVGVKAAEQYTAVFPPSKKKLFRLFKMKE